ncbi:hypothetical protein SVAN01_00317 [Stagonosporopsis vannaccii]|nr:hypothetical protein SVAN01_00317 [Stagonosporopsis vannaccii]
MPSGNNNLNVDGYSSVDLGNAAINAPYDKCESYIGHTVKDCEETTRYNQQTGGRGICRYVNTYVLVKNGKPDGQVCAMYTRSWGKEYAVNTGYHTQDSEYTIRSSLSYSNDKDPGDDKSCLNDPNTGPEPSDKPEDPKSTNKPEDPKPTSKPEDPKPTDRPEDPKSTNKPEGPKPTNNPTPKPPNEGVECFKARAWAPANRHVNGRWLDSKHDKLTAYWKHTEKDGTTFYIDREGLWRNAATDSVALWDSVISKNAWGYVKFDGKDWRKWPQITQCRIANQDKWGARFEELTCGKDGEEFKSKGFLLTWRLGHPRHAEPLRIEAVRTHCPAGGKKWW